MEKVQAEINQGRRHRVTIDKNMALEQVPAARSHDRLYRSTCCRTVAAAARLALMRQRPHRDLSGHEVVPGWYQAILEIGHERIGVGYRDRRNDFRQRGPLQFNTAFASRTIPFRQVPVAIAYGPSRVAESGRRIGVKAGLAKRALIQEVVDSRGKATVEIRKKLHGRRGEDRVKFGLEGAPDKTPGCWAGFLPA